MQAFKYLTIISVNNLYLKFKLSYCNIIKKIEINFQPSLIFLFFIYWTKNFN